jgi:signal peptidase I
MENNFNEGDIIKYANFDTSFHVGEVGREQEIRIKTIYNYYTVFLDTGESNSFEVDSTYVDNCIFVRTTVNEHRNGVPIIWEDIV